MINDQYKKMKNLFLRQSYIDAWEDYQRSIRKKSFAQWDYIVLTASNEEQANAFRSQITYRQNKNVLPCKTKYLVLPDPDGKRVGSGGATLQVLRKLAEQEDIAGDFHNKRILVIHSGGDSKRVPQYSVCGKLFSPVPRELPDGRASTLFDEFLIGMAGVPSRFREGMLVLSGDVLLLFNPLQIDAQFHGAAAISMKSPVDVGKDHGVFLNNGKDYVKKFLHKQSVETLEKLGAVNAHGNVDLDTGAVLFDVNLMNALLSLVQTDSKIDAEKYAKFVNEKSRISLYGDFLYPLAEDSTLEQYYKEQPEGTFCEELTECRTRIWEALHSFGMKLICLSPAEFIHFGTTRELLTLLTDEIADYEYLDWKPMVFTNYKAEKNVQAAVHALLSSLATGGNYVFNVFHARKFVKIDFGGIQIGRHLKPVLLIACIIFLSSIYNKIDVTMLNMMATDEAVGLYSYAQKIINMVLTMASAVTVALLPRLSYYYDNDKEEFYRLLNKGFQILCIYRTDGSFVSLKYENSQVTICDSREKNVRRVVEADNFIRDIMRE